MHAVPTIFFVNLQIMQWMVNYVTDSVVKNRNVNGSADTAFTH